MDHKVDISVDVAVVGAGVSGLVCAQFLRKKGLSTVVVEKSRGVGGRLAARRIVNPKSARTFDHGAQFFSPNVETKTMLSNIAPDCLAQGRWLTGDSKTRMFSKSGMTAFAKNIAQGLDVRLEWKAIELQKKNSEWVLCAKKEPNSAHFQEEKIRVLCKQIILSAPLPQTIELLEASKIDFDESLRGLRYEKAIVFLAELDQEPGGVTFEEPSSNGGDQDIKSVCFQKNKGVSIDPAGVIVMNEPFSENHFGDSDPVLEALGKQIWFNYLSKNYSTVRIENISVKKWRYSHPKSSIGHNLGLHAEVQPGLFLIGDAFGGGSIQGAIRSAVSLPIL